MRNTISEKYFSYLIILVICYLTHIYENMRNEYLISGAGSSIPYQPFFYISRFSTEIHTNLKQFS